MQRQGLGKYAKAIVAVAGAAVTTALTVFPPGTTLWDALTVASAALTALAVYLIPNSDPVTT